MTRNRGFPWYVYYPFIIVNHQNKTKEELIASIRELQEEYRDLEDRLSRETEIHRKEIALFSEREELFRLLVENQNDLVVKVSPEGAFLYVSPSYCKLFGKSEAELLGGTFMPLVHPDDQESTKQAMEGLNNPPYTCRVIQRAYTAKGWRWLEWIDSSQLNERQEVVAIIGVGRDITERKVAEEAMQMERHHFEHLFQSVPAGIVLLDREDRILDFNGAFGQMFRYEINEARGRHINDLIVPDNLREEGARATRDVLSGEVVDFETVRRRKDGQVFPVSIKGKPLGLTGNELAVIGVYLDISARKTAEANLLEREAQFRNLANSGLAMIWTAGTDKQFNYFNEPWLQFTGRKPDQELGIGWIDGIHPDDREPWLQAYNKAFDSRSAFDKDFRLRNVRGEYLWVRVLGSPSHNHEGRFTGFIGHCFDIDLQKHEQITRQILHNIVNLVLKLPTIEDLIKAIQAEVEKLYDTSEFFVASYQKESDTLKLLYFDEEKHGIRTWSAGNSLSGHVVKQGKSLLMNAAEITAFSQQHGLHLVGVPAKCWLGVPLFLHQEIFGAVVIQSYTNPIAYNEKTADFLRMVAHEISVYIERDALIEDLVKAKENAEESDRLKSAFLANMSHEIRTPMNGILGFAEILKNPHLSTVQQQKYIGIIEQSGQRLLNLINDIVDLSRIEAGQHEITLEAVDVHEVMDYMYAFFEPEFKRQRPGVWLSLSVPDEKTRITTDRDKLQSILMNLIKNAMKFTNGGSVRFGFRRTKDRLGFFVEDTGIGIPKDKQGRVFDRFYQVDTSFSRGHEGTGLGLPISRAFVEMLGGELTLESEHGIGSRFYFTLPAS